MSAIVQGIGDQMVELAITFATRCFVSNGAYQS
jgi:hypothetical protein